MARRADSYIPDIGKRATIQTVNGPLNGTIAIRFGRLCVEAGPTFQDKYAAIHDDSVITILSHDAADTRSEPGPEVPDRFTPGPWRIGKWGGSIVADTPIHDGVRGSDEVEYYGGYLVAESVSPSNLPLIAQAPAMLALLREIVGQEQPNQWGYDAAYIALQDNWRARARAVLAAATGVPS